MLKARFKINTDELKFTNVIKLAVDNAARVTKENVYGSVYAQVHKVNSIKQIGTKILHSSDGKVQRKCYQYSKTSHLTPDCRFAITAKYSDISKLYVARKVCRKPCTSEGTGKIQSIETCALSNTSNDFLQSSMSTSSALYPFHLCPYRT